MVGITEIQSKWLAALRSGEYQQSKDYLRNNDGYCCLGVACDIIDPDGWEESSQIKGVYTHYGNGGIIPERLREKLGLSYESMHTLISMNDEGNTFLEIADYIEKEIYSNDND